MCRRNASAPAPLVTRCATSRNGESGCARAAANSCSARLDTVDWPVHSALGNGASGSKASRSFPAVYSAFCHWNSGLVSSSAAARVCVGFGATQGDRQRRRRRPGHSTVCETRSPPAYGRRRPRRRLRSRTGGHVATHVHDSILWLDLEGTRHDIAGPEEGATGSTAVATDPAVRAVGHNHRRNPQLLQGTVEPAKLFRITL